MRPGRRGDHGLATLRPALEVGQAGRRAAQLERGRHLCFPRRCGGLARPVDVTIPEPIQQTGYLVGERRPGGRLARRPVQRDNEVVLGPRHADVAEAERLEVCLAGLLVAERREAGSLDPLAYAHLGSSLPGEEDPSADPLAGRIGPELGEDDDRELEPLGRMDREDANRISAVADCRLCGTHASSDLALDPVEKARQGRPAGVGKRVRPPDEEIQPSQRLLGVAGRGGDLEGVERAGDQLDGPDDPEAEALTGDRGQPIECLRDWIQAVEARVEVEPPLPSGAPEREQLVVAAGAQRGAQGGDHRRLVGRVDRPHAREQVTHLGRSEDQRRGVGTEGDVGRVECRLELGEPSTAGDENDDVSESGGVVALRPLRPASPRRQRLVITAAISSASRRRRSPADSCSSASAPMTTPNRRAQPWREATSGAYPARPLGSSATNSSEKTAFTQSMTGGTERKLRVNSRRSRPERAWRAPLRRARARRRGSGRSTDAGRRRRTAAPGSPDRSRDRTRGA